MTQPHDPQDPCSSGKNVTEQATDAQASSGGAADTSRAESAMEEIDALRDQVQQLTERTLRAQADFENYRKRARRDLEEQTRYASLPLIRDLLPVLDNLQRALNALEPERESNGFAAGVRMLAAQFTEVLSRHDCCRIEAEGAPFDPAWHEAIAQQPSAEQPAGVILHVSQHGYRLHDRVIRPAQVVVSAGPATASP